MEDARHRRHSVHEDRVAKVLFDGAVDEAQTALQHRSAVLKHAKHQLERQNLEAHVEILASRAIDGG